MGNAPGQGSTGGRGPIRAPTERLAKRLRPVPALKRTQVPAWRATSNAHRWPSGLKAEQTKGEGQKGPPWDGRSEPRPEFHSKRAPNTEQLWRAKAHERSHGGHPQKQTNGKVPSEATHTGKVRIELKKNKDECCSSYRIPTEAQKAEKTVINREIIEKTSTPWAVRNTRPDNSRQQYRKPRGHDQKLGKAQPREPRGQAVPRHAGNDTTKLARDKTGQ